MKNLFHTHSDQENSHLHWLLTYIYLTYPTTKLVSYSGSKNWLSHNVKIHLFHHFRSLPVLMDEGIKCQPVSPTCSKVLYVNTGIPSQWESAIKKENYFIMHLYQNNVEVWQPHSKCACLWIKQSGLEIAVFLGTIFIFLGFSVLYVWKNPISLKI